MKWVQTTSLFLLLLVTMAAAPQNPSRLRKADMVAPDWARALAASDVDEVRRGVREFRELPLYRRLSAGRFIVDAIHDPVAVESPGYERAAGTHDLRRVAGRAAYYLEQAFPLTLPTITEATSEAELKQIQESARQQYEAYRAGVMDVVRTYNIGSNPQALAKRYRDAIYVGVAKEHHSYQFFPDGRTAFEQMLHAFFPLGKKLGDLEAVMGGMARAYEPDLKGRDSSEGVTGVFEYYYTDTMFGEHYFFLVENGVITAMNVVPSS